MGDIKRILFVHHGSARGGAFESMRFLLGALDHRKYELIVCQADSDEPDVQAVLAAEGYRTCFCRLPRFAHTTLGGYSLWRANDILALWSWWRYYPVAQRELGKLIDEIMPDIVHLNSLTLAPYARAAGRNGISVVVHVREPVLSGLVGIRRAWLRRHLIKYASKVIGICRDNLDRLRLPERLGIVIYNPVPLGKFDYRIDRAVARQRLCIPEKAVVVLMTVTSTGAVKGFLPFIRAMQRLARTVSDLYCLIPGLEVPSTPHPLLTNLGRHVALVLGMFRDQRQVYNLTARGVLAGKVRGCDFALDMENWIAAADVVCVPHVRPHFSRTLLEAGAMKKPVVVSRVGGLEECVQEGVNGLLVPPGDVPALVGAVSRLLDDGAARALMGENNYRFVVAEADSALSGRRVSEVYDTLLA